MDGLAASNNDMRTLGAVADYFVERVVGEETTNFPQAWDVAASTGCDQDEAEAGLLALEQAGLVARLPYEMGWIPTARAETLMPSHFPA
jgi:hypothetical protein